MTRRLTSSRRRSSSPAASSATTRRHRATSSPSRRPRRRRTTPAPPTRSTRRSGSADSTRRHLRERIVWRASAVEYGFYEERRWTEQPTAYVERAFDHELFVRRGLRRGGVADAASCDVELLAFDEALAPAHEAVVALVVRLHVADGASLLERAVSARRPVAGADADPSAVAHAMGAALDAAVAEAGEAFVGALPAAKVARHGRGRTVERSVDAD